MATKKAESWHLVPCDGAAHSNPWQDHCMTCLPRWAEVCVPASCPDIASWRALLDSVRPSDGPAYKSLKRRQKLADTRMRKAEEAAERAEWMRKDPEAAEFVAALKDAGVVK
jgi:hypothetical protein